MKVFKKVALAAALVGTVFAANATLILGDAGLAFGNVRVTFGNVDWNAPINTPPNVIKTYGSFLTSGGSNTGVFAGAAFTAGTGITNGTIQDMSASPTDANYMPVGSSVTPLSLNFLNFAAQPGWQFSVYTLGTGTFPSSPYILTQQEGNVGALITVRGIACDTGGDNFCNLLDDKTNWTGSFSTNYQNTTVAAMAALLLGVDGIGGTADDGALPNQQWAGNILATRIPEPGSIALFGLGLVGLAAMRRRAVK